MATLYVENVPAAIYEALRARAQANRKSISAEVLALLEQNIVTAAELKERQRLLRQLTHLRSSKFDSEKRFPASEEMQREGRMR